jgi:hypothetical protein
MTFETHAEKVKNLALHPIGAGPDGNQGIDRRVLTTDGGAQTHAVAARDGDQAVVQFEAGLEGEAIDASGIAEQIEIKRGILFALTAGGKEQGRGHDDGGFAAIFNDFSDSAGIPGPKLFGYNTSVCIRKLRHVSENPHGVALALLLRFVPV